MYFYPLMSYVIGKIFSGLGNQLFQYAAAQGLATKTGRKLVFCNSAHPGDRRRYQALAGMILRVAQQRLRQRL